MDKEQVKKDLQELINDFKSRYFYYKSLSEQDVETKLVYDLFVKILGWDKNDFKQQERVKRGEKRGRADYGFYIGDKLVFFLEVKKIGVPLDKEADKQVISYALSKRVPFAISTNFEQMKIFCVEQENATTQIFRVFNKPEDYVSNFQNLMLLSKESFQQNLMLKEAESEGRLKRRMSIDKILLEDLMHIRRLIADDIEKNYPNKYNVNDKEEIVQRIIDRLIFIRRCEDVGINPENISLEEVKHNVDSKAYSRLKEIFEKYNITYNSGLFKTGEDNDCDIIKIDGAIIKKLIGYLYESKDKQYIYNFDWIDADVLGQVYEQYLGKLLQQTKSGKTRLKDGQAHKKEQGIYYTPTYIVDYIVKNTLGEVLKNKKTNPEELKILDCACGSGSFLIKVFDYLYNNLSLKEEVKQQRIDSQGTYSVKTEILKKNIFGVDLDNKAVEITKLNLLLKASEKGRKLPEEVDLHIKHGNSLIDDESIDKFAFKWDNDFKAETFDVIVGNPPYVFTRDVEFQDSFKDYVQDNYFKGSDSVSKSHARQSSKVNLYALFLIKAIKLLKNRGLFGFIIPNNILRTTTYDVVRKFILDNCKVLQIVDLGAGVFEGVTASTIILILEKEIDKLKRDKNKAALYLNINDLSKKTEVEQREFLENTSYAFNITLDKAGRNILEKIEKNTIPLGEESKYIIEGIVGNRKTDVVDSPINEKCKKFLVGKDIGKYKIDYKNKYIIYDKKRLHRARPEEVFISDKVIIQRISGGNMPLTAVLDKERYYTFASTNLLLLKENSKLTLEYVNALLNSKLINWYYVNKFTNKSTLTVNISRTYLEQIPIKIPSESQQKSIKEMVDKILSHNKDLVKLGDKTTSETKSLNEKIESLNKDINNKIFEIYGVSEKDLT